jgi:hypothetical protein
LDSALGGLGLLSSPARATAKRRTKGDLPVFLLRKSSLESVAKRFGLPAPAVKADNLVCVE